MVSPAVTEVEVVATNPPAPPPPPATTSERTDETLAGTVHVQVPIVVNDKTVAPDTVVDVGSQSFPERISTLSIAPPKRSAPPGTVAAKRSFTRPEPSPVYVNERLVIACAFVDQSHTPGIWVLDVKVLPLARNTETIIPSD
jgi:hypothetical protein